MKKKKNERNRMLLDTAYDRYAFYSMLCVTHYWQFFGIIMIGGKGEVTRAMGRLILYATI